MPVIYTDLEAKVILLTGIGQVPQEYDKQIWGNGAAMAKVLAQSKAKIFGCDLNLESAELTKQRVEQDVPGAEVEVVKTDVTKRAEVETLVNQCMQRYGRIDVLVCNVGKSAPGGPAEMSEEVSVLCGCLQVAVWIIHSLRRFGINNSMSISLRHSTVAARYYQSWRSRNQDP